VQNIYGNVYSKLSKPTNTTYNQCGILLNSVSAEDVGNWTCIVPLPDKTLTQTIELNLQNYSEHNYGYTDSTLFIIIGLIISICINVVLLLTLIVFCLKKSNRKVVYKAGELQNNAPGQHAPHQHQGASCSTEDQLPHLERQPQSCDATQSYQYSDEAIYDQPNYGQNFQDMEIYEEPTGKQDYQEGSGYENA
ncbi:unnamed protein product, partial [Meganyctiphanes norvegica]